MESELRGFADSCVAANAKSAGQSRTYAVSAKSAAMLDRSPAGFRVILVNGATPQRRNKLI